MRRWRWRWNLQCQISWRVTLLCIKADKMTCLSMKNITTQLTLIHISHTTEKSPETRTLASAYNLVCFRKTLKRPFLSVPLTQFPGRQPPSGCISWCLVFWYAMCVYLRRDIQLPNSRLRIFRMDVLNSNLLPRRRIARARVGVIYLVIPNSAVYSKNRAHQKTSTKSETPKLLFFGIFKFLRPCIVSKVWRERKKPTRCNN